MSLCIPLKQTNNLQQSRSGNSPGNKERGKEERVTYNGLNPLESKLHVAIQLATTKFSLACFVVCTGDSLLGMFSTW